MKKNSQYSQYIVYITAVLFIVGVSGFFAPKAQALTVQEANQIIATLNLPTYQANILKALTSQPYSPVIVTMGNLVTLKQGESIQFDWVAPANFKNVGILLRKANGELASVINSGNITVSNEHFQHFTFSVPADLPPDLYYITIYPIPLGATPWNTSLFKIVLK